MEYVLVSACLLGLNCKYDGGNNRREEVLELLKRDDVVLIPVCPEIFGGEGIPRENSEIVGGDGRDVLEGKAKVLTPDGKDVTEYFIRGARETLKVAKLYGAKRAIFKARSPSCGCGWIYDGTFSRRLRKGDGVATALLKANGVEVITDEEL